MPTPKSEWVHMGHPQHFICARDCRFHLATYVGGYIVSTVGEYLPDSAVWEILASSRGITLEGRGDERLADFMRKVGYEDIDHQRKYETMVFAAGPRIEEDGAVSRCCPWMVTDHTELAFCGYNDAGDAAEGHAELCREWAMKGDALASAILEAVECGDDAASAALAGYEAETLDR